MCKRKELILNTFAPPAAPELLEAGAMMRRAQKAEKLFPATPLDSTGVREVWFSSHWTPACFASSTADCGLLPDSRSGVSSENWQCETSED